MELWVQAGLWGLLAGSALVLGAAIAWFFKVPQDLTAAVMAFGAGVLISALAFDLVDEAYAQGGLAATALGFAGGAATYIVASLLLAFNGGRHRGRTESNPPEGEASAGSGLAIALGALLDGVPESIVLGISLLDGGGVGVSVLAAIFVSNIPEGLSSAASMKASGRSASYVFGVWGGIALITGVAGALGVLVFADASDQMIAVVTSVAAGAMLTMICDTMIPEAFEKTHLYTGAIASFGFLVAFSISKGV